MDSAAPPRKRIVIVEDEDLVARSLEEYLKRNGFAVPAIFRTGEDVLREVPQINPDLVLMDVVLGGSLDGIEAADRIHNLFGIPIIYLTAHSDDEVLRRVARSAPYGYLIKPCEIRQLLSVIEIALARHQIEQALFEGERRYRAIFDNVSDAIMVNEVSGDTIGLFVDVNEAALHKLGYEREEMLKLSLMDICDENCADDCAVMLRKLLEEGRAACEMILVGKGEHRLLVSVNARQFLLNGKMLVLSICHDCAL
jgi:PAS domain S-box-containing protein